MGQPMDRRTALRAAASAPLAGLFVGSMTAQQNSAPPDPPREITSDRADIGSLFRDIERLVSRNQYPYSFLTSVFRSLEEYRAAGRRAVLDAFGYQPALVPAAALRLCQPATVAAAQGKRLLRKRGELIERTFAHCYDTGGMRRTHLRKHPNILKRLLVHVAGMNLELLLRSSYGIERRAGCKASRMRLIFWLLSWRWR